jgi:hypothetical protein
MTMNEEEKVVLNQPKASAALTPKRGLARAIFEIGSGYPDLLWAGGVKLPFDTPLKLVQVALTERHIVLFQKFTLSKKLNVMRLPLQYAKEVVGGKVLWDKFIDVNFVVPQTGKEEKPLEFRLRVNRLKDSDAWVREIKRITSTSQARAYQPP